MGVQAKLSRHPEIEALFTRLRKAHAEKNAEAILEAYAPNAVIYDLAPPLGRRGMSRDEVADWLVSWDGPVIVEARDADLSVEGNLACCTALNRMRGRQGGKEQDLWYRSTVCLRRTGHEWHIVHEHTSVPFYMDGSYRAAVDLMPQV